MATKYADIHVKVDSEVKEESEKILAQIGISMSDLINMTLRRVNYMRDIPFNTSVIDNDFSEIQSADDLKSYLEKIEKEDDGTRYTADEVWAEVNDHIKMLKAERRRDARIRSRLYA